MRCGLLVLVLGVAAAFHREAIEGNAAEDDVAVRSPHGSQRQGAGAL